MYTDRYCPKCARRLKEIRYPGGGVDVGSVVCKNGHFWTWTVHGSKEWLYSSDGEDSLVEST